MALQNCQIQLQLAGKMLVENWFADPGSVGYLVHTGRAVATIDEDLTSYDQQLAATLVTRQSVAAPGGGAHGAARLIAGTPLAPTPFGGVGEIAHQVLNLICR